VATSLVGSSEDIRDLIAFRFKLEGAPRQPPLLTRGWRATVVGQVIEELLAGHLAIRIRDATAEQPLEFIPCPPAAPCQSPKQSE
jgi:hypothetical protein